MLDHDSEWMGLDCPLSWLVNAHFVSYSIQAALAHSLLV